MNPNTTTVAALGTIGESYLSGFPYLGTPWDGFGNPSTTPVPVLSNP